MFPAAVIYFAKRKVLEMAAKNSVIQRLLEQADLQEEALPREPIVELLGDGRVLIENHRGVTEYCTEKIQARVSFGGINVVGRNLRLRQMTAEKLVIYGTIDAIEVLRGRLK